MSRYISLTLRARIAAQAHYRCGYCLTAEAIIGAPLEIDHLIPEALGGQTEENNLWLACSFCNDYKSDRIAGRDPLTETIVPFFNPRLQVWREHFQWIEEGAIIQGITSVGRATELALHLNRLVLVRARRLWIKVGWHPPQE